jgi:hypothetical protein
VVNRALRDGGAILIRRMEAMKVHTYLNFGGNCAEAFKFYEEQLGAKAGMMMKQARCRTKAR